MKTIFFDQTGPLIRYDVGSETLHIDDLNPSLTTRWKMTRWEMIRTGWRFIAAGFLRP